MDILFQTAKTFYTCLREEILNGNPYLTQDELASLRTHYPVMLNPKKYPPDMAATIYSCRRSHAVKSIQQISSPVVFDAGCGFGSESFLFASLGARVVAIDMAESKIVIAEKRKQYYEELFGKHLRVKFVVANLEDYTPEIKDISFTWLGSVLAAVREQNRLLERIYSVTCRKGEIMISDMNLLNPLFLSCEWRRRRQAKRRNPEFARTANFLTMVMRRGRKGAQYFGNKKEEFFDDAQFFSSFTLRNLLASVGFKPYLTAFSGFVPPELFRFGLGPMEHMFSRLPVIRALGYFYVVGGIR